MWSVIRRVENDGVLINTTIFQPLDQPTKLGIEHGQSSQIIGILLVHVVERGHSRMRLVNRMEAQVSVEGPPLLSHCFVHKGEEVVNNERSIVSGYFCSELVDTARVGRVWIVVIGARVAPVGLYATTNNTLIAIWCYVVVA